MNAARASLLALMLCCGIRCVSGCPRVSARSPGRVVDKTATLSQQRLSPRLDQGP